MDKKRLDILKRLREILLTMSLATCFNYLDIKCRRQIRHLKKTLGSLSDTLFQECILDYQTRKKMFKEFRDILEAE